MINEMLSVVVSEYLFSGRLAGQKNNQILMTYGHRYEVGRSYKALIDAQQRYQASPGWRNERHAVVHKLDDLPEDDEIDLRLEQDLEGVGEENRDAFVRSRRLARLFATQKDALVGDQLLRFARDIWPNIQAVGDRFVFDEADLKTIDKETLLWERRFHEIIGANQRTERRAPGLRRDATALATIQHIARWHLDPDERIVFVTGDSLMLEVYWRWYAEAYVKDISEPNIIRSVGRFSPVVNVGDLLESSEGDSLPFKRLQVAINLAVQPFNLKARESLEKTDGQQVANLWDFRRRIVESLNDGSVFEDGFFDNTLTNALVDDSDREFAKVRDLFQTYERNACRAGLHLLEQRREVIRAIRAQERPARHDASALRYFGEDTRTLVQANIRVWLPLVLDFMNAHQDRSIPLQLRPPITLSLRMRLRGDDHDDGELENILEIEKRLRKVSAQDLARPELLSHLVFVLAAVYAVRHRMWAEAETFADLAKLAYISLASEDLATSIDSPDYQELRYLSAVTARMALGAVRRFPTDGRPGSLTPEKMWQQSRAKAEGNLDACISIHIRDGARLRIARAYSERASLRLFHASRIFYADLEHGTQEVSGAVKATCDAAEDLISAFEMLREAEVKPEETDRIAMRQGVERHVLANVAAIDGFAIRIPSLQKHVGQIRRTLSPALDAAVETLPALPAADFPVVVREEITDFLGRRGVNIRSDWGSSSGVRLPVDREIQALFKLPIHSSS